MILRGEVDLHRLLMYVSLLNRPISETTVITPSDDLVVKRCIKARSLHLLKM